MQKIAKRAATAERVALKRRTKRQQILEKHNWKESYQQSIMQTREVGRQISVAKQAIRDEFHLGSAAPRTHFGDKYALEGAVSTERFRSAYPLSEKVKEARCAWLGGTKNLNLVQGDRVVLLEGADAGRIGHIGSIDHERCEVTVPELNKVSFP
jgi:large subunit ribosomal protein L24